MSNVNWVAVIVSAIVSMVIGSLWFGPLFGKKFMHAMGMDTWTPEKQAEMKKSMTMSYVLQLVGSIVMFYVLAHFIGGLDQMSIKGGICIALWVWIGFVVPVQLGNAIWGGNRTVFWLTAGNMLITLLVAGAIIGAWA